MTILHLIDLLEPRILAFTTVLIRVSFFMIFLPLWGDMSLPGRVRLLLIVAMSMALAPVIEVDMDRFPTTFGALALSMVIEVMFCFSVAFLLHIVFGGILLAGQIMGQQLGFAFGNMVSPEQFSQIPVLARALYAFAILFFLVMNFHIETFRIMAESFQKVPSFQAHPDDSILEIINMMASGMYETSIQLSAPIIATMVFINVALGIINKAVPQIHVLIMSFPIRILLGLFMFSTILGMIAQRLGIYLSDSLGAMQLMVEAWMG